MSAGFTPGPWRYSLTDDERHAVVSPPLDAGDDIGPWFTAIVQCADDEVEDANARLIAAAPELYDAAEAMFAARATLEAISTSNSKAFDAALADHALTLERLKGALAKARGEQASDPLLKEVRR